MRRSGNNQFLPNNKATAAGVTGPISLTDVSWERMIGAVEKVKERLRRATISLDRADIPYAVVEGNAVAAWSLGSMKPLSVTPRTWTC